MSGYIKEHKKEDIYITDIYWDRIYLHIKIDGSAIQDKNYIIATRKERYSYPIELDTKTNEFVLNITNIRDQAMLSNGDWYVKYENKNYEQEMQDFAKNLEEYQNKINRNPTEEEIEEELLPHLWEDIPLSLEVCSKLKDLDKIYRYSSDNYAYLFSFALLESRGELLCRIQATFMIKNRKPEKRYFWAETANMNSQLKKMLIFYLEKGINIFYQIMTRIYPKKGNRILLMSETRDMGGNIKALDDRLKERNLNKKFKVTYYFAKTLESSRFKILFIWLKMARLVAKQDFIFVDDYVPFFKYVNLSPKTKLIQVWHAGVGFKSVGYARFGEAGSPYPFASCHRKYDYAIVGGEALRDVYAEVFGINREQCLPYGLMRIDGYMDVQKIKSFKNEFYQKYENLKSKKIILFAPTFRGNGQRDACYPYEILDQEKIYNMCGEEYVFLIKMHPFIAEKIQIDEKYKERVIEFSEFPDINQLFYVTDILITDYSSNIYEFSLQNKPIIFFAYDKEEYELIRSVHRTLDKDAPGKVCTTLDDVIQTIETQDFEMEKLEKFVQENFDDVNGNATDKVIDNILLKHLE
ncbi:MAG: CDP-glycerol glycerophosphotransferase family protein [Lachnospiraceae bacterium]